MSPADVRYFEHGLMAMSLALPRLIVCCFWVHVFGSSIFPKTFRVAIALGLSLPVVPSVWASLDHVTTSVPYFALLFKECVLGFLMGFSLCTPFWAIEAVGAILDNARGANTSSQVTPFSSPDLSMIGAVLRFSFIAYLVATDGLTPLYELMLASFEAWPIMSLVPDLGGFSGQQLVARFSEFTRLLFLYAAPIFAIMGLIDFGFALVNVFAPQLPTYFAAMPVKSIVGMFILALYMGLLMRHGGEYFARVVDKDLSSFRSLPVEKGR